MNRALVLALALIVAFGAIAAILLVLTPGPHKTTDYLVIGAIGTFLCMLLLFFVLMKTIQKPDEYKRRKPE